MAAAKKQLARNVTVGGDTFPAGTKVGDEVNGVKFTAEIEKSIENPKAWEPVEEQEPVDASDDSEDSDAGDSSDA